MLRNSLALNGFRLNPVEDFSIFAGFTCLAPHDTDRDLDDFIQNDAERHFLDRIAVTYQLLVAEGGPPLGFATLQNDAVVLAPEDDLPGVSEAYPYRAYPAVKIGRFGIHTDYQRGKLGSLFLLMIKILLVTHNRTGCRFITVDARRDKKNKVDVTGFYAKNSFEVLPCRSRTSKYVPMYFDLVTFSPPAI